MRERERIVVGGKGRKLSKTVQEKGRDNASRHLIHLMHIIFFLFPGQFLHIGWLTVFWVNLIRKLGKDVQKR